MRIKERITDISKIVIGVTVAFFMKLNKNNNDVWLVSERRDEAEDNGYHLYKYIRESHPEKKAYYIIDKKANSYKKIQKYKTIIQQNSLKHYIYYFLSNKHISAFQFFGVPDNSLIWRLEEKALINKEKIFIQHGVIQSKLPFLFYKNTDYRMFVCGAKPEYDYVKENYGYPEKNIKYLGLCRYDNLHNYSEKNQILIMPTWRKWLGMTGWESNTQKDNINFIESEYFQRYKSLINNFDLNNLLNKYGYELVFYPHPEMQRFINLFNCKYKSVRIASRKNDNLQGLLKESKILITDYSSVAFDYAYMKKPLVYYQFDREKYSKDHFENGYFNHERDGFGPVIIDEGNLVEVIEDYILKRIDRKIYIRRCEEFFPLHDKNNCKRNYETINNI